MCRSSLKQQVIGDFKSPLHDDNLAGSDHSVEPRTANIPEAEVDIDTDGLYAFRSRKRPLNEDEGLNHPPTPKRTTIPANPDVEQLKSLLEQALNDLAREKSVNLLLQSEVEQSNAATLAMEGFVENLLTTVASLEQQYEATCRVMKQYMDSSPDKLYSPTDAFNNNDTVSEASSSASRAEHSE